MFDREWLDGTRQQMHPREWNRRIEAEIHRLASKQDDGPWKIRVWVLLEVVWSGALVVVQVASRALLRPSISTG